MKIHIHVGKTKDAELTEERFKQEIAAINRKLTEAAKMAEVLLKAASMSSGMGQLSNQARVLEEAIDTARHHAFKIR